MRASPAFILLLGLLAGGLAAGCGPKVDLATGLQVVEPSSGWWDAGIVNGQNKVVPAVTFKVKNVADRPLPALQVNVIFRRVSDEDAEWGSGFVTISGSDGLAPGASSKAIDVKSPLGYTGTDSRDQLLHNSQFVDAKAQIFAKYSSTQWVRVAEVPVERRLIAK